MMAEQLLIDYFIIAQELMVPINAAKYFDLWQFLKAREVL
jgi:hypothetical protein